MDITPAQLRAARELLGWSQEKLAQHASVGIETIRQLEAQAGEPARSDLDAYHAALLSAGVQILPDRMVMRF
jgi:transcriptional regulator with XRE-family HTH domain